MRGSPRSEASGPGVAMPVSSAVEGPAISVVAVGAPALRSHAVSGCRR